LVIKKAAIAGGISPGALALVGTTTGYGIWTTAAVWFVGLTLFVGASSVVWHRIRTPAMQTVHQTFRSKSFDSDFFKWTGPSPGKYARREAEGLRITLPAQNGPARPLGVTFRYPVHGDFELEASFEILQIARSKAVWGSGVTLYLFQDDADWNGFWFGKTNQIDRGPSFVTGHRIKKGDERETKYINAVEAAGEQGITRLKIVRRGTIVSLFAAEGETADYQHLNTLEISNEDVETVRFATDPSWTDDAAMDIRLLDLSITAEGLVGYRRSDDASQ
jgi:hypothetical protein